MTALRGVRLLAACGVAAVSCAVAAQQPDGKALLKGRVKPGMYETKAYNDLTGMPGIPKEQQKTTETTTRCVTPAEIEKGVELRSDCKVKDFKQTASSFEIVSTCPDGSHQELRIAATAAGFNSVIKSESKEKGKEHNMTMRTESRYLGACKG